MEQIPKPINNQKDNKNSINAPLTSPGSIPPPAASSEQSKSQTPPASLLSFTSQKTEPIQDNDPKLIVNANTQHSGQQFKLASTEVQGPKPPLVPNGISKYALIAAGIILVVLVAGGYYFYSQDNNSQPTGSPAAISPKVTPVADKNLDSDKDGLPDEIEKVLSTYITKADTDGDGYNDLEEIKNGYSPLISGGAGKYSQEEWDIVKGKIKIEDREFYEKEFETQVVPVQNSSPSPEASLSPSPIEGPN